MSDVIFENYVVSEIAKSWLNSGEEPPIHYYRDKDGKEIDVILECDGKAFPVGITRASTTDSKMIDDFKALDKAGIKRGKGAVISMAEQLENIDDENVVVPVRLI